MPPDALHPCLPKLSAFLLSTSLDKSSSPICFRLMSEQQSPPENTRPHCLGTHHTALNFRGILTAAGAYLDPLPTSVLSPTLQNTIYPSSLRSSHYLPSSILADLGSFLTEETSRQREFWCIPATRSVSFSPYLDHMQQIPSSKPRTIGAHG